MAIFAGGRYFFSSKFMVLAFLGLTWTALTAVAMVTYSIYTVVQQTKTQKKATSEAKKTAAQQLAAEREYAGQYLTLSREQMEMQSQQRRIDTLANLISEERTAQPRIYTLPKGTEPSIVEQINTAIGRIFRG